MCGLMPLQHVQFVVGNVGAVDCWKRTIFWKSLARPLCRWAACSLVPLLCQSFLAIRCVAELKGTIDAHIDR